MKAALFVTASTLVGSAFSIHARHAAFHEKKDVVQNVQKRMAPGLDYACCKKVVTVTVYEEGE